MREELEILQALLTERGQDSHSGGGERGAEGGMQQVECYYKIGQRVIEQGIRFCTQDCD